MGGKAIFITKFQTHYILDKAGSLCFFCVWVSLKRL